MLYILTQTKEKSIPINDSIIVSINRVGETTLYSVIAANKTEENTLGIYDSKEVCRQIVKRINAGRARQQSSYMEMPEKMGAVKQNG